MKIKAIFALSLALTAFGIAGGESLQKPAVLRSIGMHPVERLSTAMPPSPFSTPLLFSAATEQLFIPSAARVLGAHGTDWRTDMMLFNPADSPIIYSIYYTPGGMDGTTTPYIYSGILEAHESPLLTNIIESLFHLTNSAGSIRILSDGPLKAASRTYNQTALGTYGQFVPGCGEDKAISGSSGPAEIIGIINNDKYRTNLGFSEVIGAPTMVSIAVFDSLGEQLLVTNVQIQPYSWLQISLSDLGISIGEDLRAEISITSGGAVLAYASVVDNRTGDAIFIPNQGPWPWERGEQLVPVIAKAEGSHDTSWRTDLYVFNPSGSSAFAIRYYSALDNYFAYLSLKFFQTKVINNVVNNLFSQQGDWTPRAHMNTGRTDFTATLLPDGNVLAAGGITRDTWQVFDSAELFDPAGDTWSYAATMTTPRYEHTATLLSSGKVLIAGGTDDRGNVLSNAELFDPQAGAWFPIAPMSAKRCRATACLLTDGTVLVVGGMDGQTALASAERYDPRSDTWIAVGSMRNARQIHRSVLLADGDVLVIGGYSEAGVASDAERYHPESGTWSDAGSLYAPLLCFSATVLKDGRVLVAGGQVNYPPYILGGATIYDPAAGIWSRTTGMRDVRSQHEAVLLPDGRVLVAGGYNLDYELASAEIYNPLSDVWSTVADMDESRLNPKICALRDGGVLAIGGAHLVSAGNNSLDGSELFEIEGMPDSSGVFDPQSWSEIMVSRTFNQTPNGTYGQYVPAKGTSELLRYNETGQILLVVNSDTYRCNVGFSVKGGFDSQVEVSLFDTEGRLLISSSQPIGVPGHLQLPLGDLLGYSAAIPAGRIEVTVYTGINVYAYASVVDNRTGDAIFIPAIK